MAVLLEMSFLFGAYCHHEVIYRSQPIQYCSVVYELSALRYGINVFRISSTSRLLSLGETISAGSYENDTSHICEHLRRVYAV